MTEKVRFAEDVIADHSNSLLFSCTPELPKDDPADVITESLAVAWHLTPDERAEARGIIAAALESCDPDASASDHMLGRHEIAAELLRMFAEQPNGQLIAHVMLVLINRNPYSELDIARKLGVTKAAVSKVKVMLQERYGLRPRCGRSDKSREKFSDLCTQRHQKRLAARPRGQWIGASALKQAIGANK